MTREEIEKMESGPELDALVAEKVMGWCLFKNCGETWACPGKHCPDKQNRKKCGRKEYDRKLAQGCGDILMFKGRHYGFFPPGWSASTDISAAWQVAATLSQFAVKRMIGRWEVLCFDGITGHKASADTAPLAICRAALLAVEPRREEEREI